MTAYTRGVLWGIIPTVLFFAVASSVSVASYRCRSFSAQASPSGWLGPRFISGCSNNP